MRILFIIPGDINLPTGGYRYDKEIINAWERSGIDVSLVSIDGNYPFHSKQENIDAIVSIKALPKADMAVVDGLLGGAAPDFLEALSKKMPIAALIHHPLCLENGLDKETATSLEKSEKHGLNFCELIITTSPTTSKTVSNLFNFNADNIYTILPGVERGTIATGSNSNYLNLLCVGSVIERKGHKDLLLALAALKTHSWKLDCIGSTHFDEVLFDDLQKIIKQESLYDKIKFHGSVNEDTLEASYTKADLFVLPSLYEGYGMAYAEAIVRGIPVIGTTAGAIPETVPKTCGILVAPSSISELTQALEQMITDDELRNQYRNNTLKAEAHFPTWEASANQFSKILRKQI